MPNYQNGKIYKIVCNNTNKQYIGSTCFDLSSRLQQHTYFPSNHCVSKEIIEEGNYDIILVENYPCNNKEELEKRERHYIETLNCINVVIPGRTKKEWYKDNKEHISEKAKEYYEDNKEHFSERAKEYYEANKELLLEQNKEYREANRDKLNERQKEKFNCECGGRYTRVHKKRHLNSKKHLNYLN